MIVCHVDTTEKDQEYKHEFRHEYAAEDEQNAAQTSAPDLASAEGLAKSGHQTEKREDMTTQNEQAPAWAMALEARIDSLAAIVNQNGTAPAAVAAPAEVAAPAVVAAPAEVAAPAVVAAPAETPQQSVMRDVHTRYVATSQQRGQQGLIYVDIIHIESGGVVAQMTPSTYSDDVLIAIDQANIRRNGERGYHIGGRGYSRRFVGAIYCDSLEYDISEIVWLMTQPQSQNQNGTAPAAATVQQAAPAAATVQKAAPAAVQQAAPAAVQQAAPAAVQQAYPTPNQDGHIYDTPASQQRFAQLFNAGLRPQAQIVRQLDEEGYRKSKGATWLYTQASAHLKKACEEKGWIVKGAK